MAYSVAPEKVAALRARFGDLLDVEAEVRSALDYAENFHTGRPYKNVGKFLWNWCLRSEERRLAGMPARQREQFLRRRGAPDAAAVAKADSFPPLSKAELLLLLEDPLPQIREMAAEQLKFMESTGASVQDKD